jgi:hypothetical protein
MIFVFLYNFVFIIYNLGALNSQIQHRYRGNRQSQHESTNLLGNGISTCQTLKMTPSLNGVAPNKVISISTYLGRG